MKGINYNKMEKKIKKQKNSEVVKTYTNKILTLNTFHKLKKNWQLSSLQTGFFQMKQ